MRTFVVALIAVTCAGGELYSQLGPQGVGTTASYRSSATGADVMAADDFIVPTGETWDIAAVAFDFAEVTCRIKGGGLTFDVSFFADSGGLPGGMIAQYMDVPLVATGLNLTPPLSLPEGTYWVSAQFRFTTNCSGHLGTTSIQRNSPYAWQTGGIIGSGCDTWGVGFMCNPVSSEPDLAFALYDSTFVELSVPTLDAIGHLAFFLVMIAAGVMVIKRKGN